MKKYEDGALRIPIEVFEELCDILGLDKVELLKSSTEFITQSSYEDTIVEDKYYLNILGNVSCGLPSEAIENVIDTIEVDKKYSVGHFGLYAKGNSMFPYIQENDILIVKTTSIVDNNKIAIVKIDDEDATCKKVVINNGILTTIPLNNEYDIKSYPLSKNVCIIGQVVQIIRNID